MSKEDWWVFVNTPCPNCGERPGKHLSPVVEKIGNGGRGIYEPHYALVKPAKCAPNVRVRTVGMRVIVTPSGKGKSAPRAPFTQEQHLQLGLWARSTGIHKHPGRTWRGWLRLPAQRKKREEGRRKAQGVLSLVR